MEREVSLTTSRQVAQALSGNGCRCRLIDPADYLSPQALLEAILSSTPDIVFNGLHGGAGEDGRLQALLELAGIPFTGSRHAASAIAMDKLASQRLAECVGLATPQTFSLRPADNPAGAIAALGFPLVVKPNNGGSSVGITIVDNADDMAAAIDLARRCDSHVLLQRFIDGRELTVTILDQSPLPVVEIKPCAGWYDYKHKYTKGETVYEAPAVLEPGEVQTLQQQALAIYQAMGCEGYARIDFRSDDEANYFLEVNTLPGLTPLSLTPMAATEAGYTFQKLLETIIGVALRADWPSPFNSEQTTKQPTHKELP